MTNKKSEGHGTFVTTIARRLQFEPSILNERVDENVKDRVRQKYVNYCSKNDGYILDILDVKIVDCEISPTNSSVQCDVEFDARCMKPFVGDVRTGKVCLIFERGVLLELDGVLKVLVPRDEKGGFVVDDKHVPYEYSLAGPSPCYIGYDIGDIETAQERHVKLTGVQYNPQTQAFNCYGTFVSICRK
tara:strand:+ start:7312 stop:7875 length:564 start_codon:yes stop_codon:yes gene_type:complete